MLMYVHCDEDRGETRQDGDSQQLPQPRIALHNPQVDQHHQHQIRHVHKAAHTEAKKHTEIMHKHPAYTQSTQCTHTARQKGTQHKASAHTNTHRGKASATRACVLQRYSEGLFSLHVSAVCALSLGEGWVWRYVYILLLLRV